MDPRAAQIKKRLQGMLLFLDAASPDMHNYFADAIQEAESLEVLQDLERQILEGLKPKNS